MNRSTEIVIPQNVHRLVGSSESTKVIVAPYRSTAMACTTMSTPSVATMRASGDARRRWRITSRCTSAPMTAQVSRPAAQATATGWPCSTLTSHST